MKLLTEELKNILPNLCDQDGKGAEAIVYAKFFDPYSGWTWYVMEGQVEGDDYVFFGLVDGHFREFGYFTLNELESVTQNGKPRIERDLSWKPTRIGEIYPEFYARD